MLQVVDLNDSLIDIALREHFAPLSLFKDSFCEEMRFPSLLFGHERKYYEAMNKKYPKVAK